MCSFISQKVLLICNTISDLVEHFSSVTSLSFETYFFSFSNTSHYDREHSLEKGTYGS